MALKGKLFDLSSVRMPDRSDSCQSGLKIGTTSTRLLQRLLVKFSSAVFKQLALDRGLSIVTA